MTFATSLQSTARTLIDQFGCDCTVYDYSSASKTENGEGDITVSDWKTGTSTSCVMGDELESLNVVNEKGTVTDKTARVIFKDNVTIDVNDKVNLNSRDYIVDEIDTSNRISGTLIVKIVMMSVR